MKKLTCAEPGEGRGQRGSLAEGGGEGVQLDAKVVDADARLGGGGGNPLPLVQMPHHLLEAVHRGPQLFGLHGRTASYPPLINLVGKLDHSMDCI